MFLRSFCVAVLLVHSAFACGDSEHHHLHKRSPPSIPLTPPTRPLEWGDINIIHTTDSHGWLLGHQKETFPEPNYSADLGDFASFVEHMKRIASHKNVDLLVVDSGDLHDGSGLTDGFPPGGVNGHDAMQFLKRVPYDVMAIGNHELYQYPVTVDMHADFSPGMKGHYLSSNVNITYTDPKTGDITNVPVGKRFAKFRTTMGRKVTALGVMFEFAANHANSTVQKIADMVQEPWFKEAIADEPHFFLLAGHMPVNGNKWPLVHEAIRAVHPKTPILILGGHTHIRDCVQLDGRSMSIASGQYMETVGWMSMKFGRTPDSNLRFTRRYMDANRLTYQYHTRTNRRTFSTREGREITRGLLDLAARYDLGHIYGIAPQDYFLRRAPYPSEQSELSLFIEQAVPTALSVNNSRADVPALYVAQAGSQRFDLYRGPFTRNDVFSITPYINGFVYVPNIPYWLAKEVTPRMNADGSWNRKRELEDVEQRFAMGEVDDIYYDWLHDMHLRASLAARGEEAANATLGYVTEDSCPGVGDDTFHVTEPIYPVPPFIVSNPPKNVTDDSPVDLVFVDYFYAQMLYTLSLLDPDRDYTIADLSYYSPLTTDEILAVFAQEAW